METAFKREMTKQDFIDSLVKAGWTQKRAEEEWEFIQSEEDESGYDGP